MLRLLQLHHLWHLSLHNTATGCLYMHRNLNSISYQFPLVGGWHLFLKKIQDRSHISYSRLGGNGMSVFDIIPHQICATAWLFIWPTCLPEKKTCWLDNALRDILRTTLSPCTYLLTDKCIFAKQCVDYMVCWAKVPVVLVPCSSVFTVLKCKWTAYFCTTECIPVHLLYLITSWSRRGEWLWFHFLME